MGPFCVTAISIFMSSGRLKVTAASAGANKKQYISKCETGGSVIKVGFENCFLLYAVWLRAGHKF